jgi:hypothetical protein
MDRRPSRTPIVLVLLALCATASAAQEFRGTVTGRVTDSSGLVVPGATVTVTNTATGVAATATTNEAGSFTVPYLTPGSYTVAFELTGFHKVVRSVELRVGDRLEVDATLQPGAVAETVSVTAQVPLLGTTTGSAGQVIDEKTIASLPLADGNPFILARFAVGVTYYGDLKFSRPFDNAGTSAVVADGAPGGNEFMIDGSPNEANKSGGLPRVAYVPSSDSVQEFKVESASYDAQQGHTAGATVNVVLKSGTNSLKGDAYGYWRSDKLAANDFFLNRSGTPNPGLDYRHWGGTVGGPIVRNRTFFFAAYERLTDRFPEPNQFTVPTLAERQGDLSALLPLGIKIYDPKTAAKQPDGSIARTAFGNNVLPPDRLNQVALNYLQYYPLPNQAGDVQGRNNYFSPQVRTDTFYTELYRVDHALTDSQKLFARYYRNHRIEDRGNWSGVTNGVRATGNYLFRINDGITADYVHTISPRMLLDVRGGWSRFQELNKRESEGAIDPASLGFSPQTASLFGGVSYLPRFLLSTTNNGPFSPLGDSLGDGTIHSIYSLQPTLTRLMGSHSLRAGYDFRIYKESHYGQGNAAGTYTFQADFTKQTNLSSAQPIGQELASFLLGIPTSGSIDVNTDRLNYGPYNAAFVQDDWKATEKLTVNLGLRYEYESATTEQSNRNLRGFDSTTPSPVAAAAEAAYALNPIPQLPPSDFHVNGGLTFAGAANPAFWYANKNNFEPRAGFAYSVNDSTVVRGGFGIYAVPFIIDAVNQTGFSQSTSLVPSLDTGLTFVANLTNPFPNGKQAPTGAALGLGTNLGRSLTGTNSVIPVDRPQAHSARWSIGVQRQLRDAWLVEAAYIGSHGYNLTTGIDINPIPAEFLSTSPMRDPATIAALDGTVPSPFAGLPLVANTALNGNVMRSQLLKPFPQFTGLTSQAYDGTNQYNAAQFRIDRRFNRGYSLQANYTWSHFTERVSKLNPTDTQYEKRISENDVPHRLTVSGIWELPFGRGHAHGGGSALANALAGGWSVQALGQAQSGRPLCQTGTLPTGQVALFGSNPCVFFDSYFNGDPTQLRANISSSTVDKAFDTSGFYFHDAVGQTLGAGDPRINLADHIRTFPTRLEDFRGQALVLWDISAIKRFEITERVRLQLEFQMLNAFNRPQFATPGLDPRSSDFGKVTSQSNLPRNIQLAAKLLF